MTTAESFHNFCLSLCVCDPAASDESVSVGLHAWAPKSSSTVKFIKDPLPRLLYLRLTHFDFSLWALP